MNRNNNMSRTLLLLAILLVPAALFFWNPQAGAAELRFFYANDNAGELESCG
jgi:hypothetical protein